MIAVLVTFALLSQAPVTLPNTPQGKQVQAFISALNSSEAAFVKFQDDHMLPKRTPEQLKTMYGRVKKSFGEFKILRVVSASNERLTLIVAHASGEDATVTFSFEPASPHRITNLEVEIG
jgi:hypothetical protein